MKLALHCAGLWPWLSDKGHTRETRWLSLRIVRVRDQAPQLIQRKTTRFHQAEDGSHHPRHHRPAAVPRLFRIDASRAATYWSLAKPQGNYKRGESCYRRIELADTRKEQPMSIRSESDIVTALADDVTRSISEQVISALEDNHGSSPCIIAPQCGSAA